MTDPRTIPVARIAETAGARIVGNADTALARVGARGDADASTLSFVRSPAFVDRWRASRAGAALVTPAVAEAIVGDSAAPTDPRPLIVVDDTDLALVAILPLFGDVTNQAESAAPGIDPGATVAPSATIDPGAHIGPGCRIGPAASVATGARLIANVVLGAGVRLDEGVVLHPGVVVGERCTIGAGTIVHPNAVVGADGFNFRPAPDGSGLVKIPHIAAVTVGRHAEIGACTTIDRGKFEDTVIGDGTKIDNLVQVGHNCRVGRGCLICGRCGLSGSVTLGDAVVLAGGVGIADNLAIGAGATIGAGAGVMNDIPPGETWLGAPAQPVREAMANLNAFRSLSADLRALRKQARALGARLDAIDSSAPAGGA